MNRNIILQVAQLTKERQSWDVKTVESEAALKKVQEENTRLSNLLVRQSKVSFACSIFLDLTFALGAQCRSR